LPDGGGEEKVQLPYLEWSDSRGGSHEGDDAAVERDVAAQRRDQAADRRDRAAERFERADGRFSRAESERAAGDRQRSAHDRRQAAHDRRCARSDRRQAGREWAQAGLDGLTGALRRERGMSGLQQEIDRARRSDGRLVVAFVDVDGLKEINDADGHAAGDQVLRVVAAALSDGLRSYDLVVRYGGDEFLCGLPGSDLKGAQRCLDTVANTVAERDPLASVSMGLAELTNPDTLDVLIARADAALYADRQDARGQAANMTPRFKRDALRPSDR
jgi:diguanylate cyclase (GGDEF)-like protein